MIHFLAVPTVASGAAMSFGDFFKIQCEDELTVNFSD